MDQPSNRTQPRLALWWVPFSAALALAPEFLPGGWALGWLALAPAFALLRDHGRVATWAALGWGYGLVYWAGQFAWLHTALVVHGGMGWLHFANFFALFAAVLALLWAALFAGARQAWLSWRLSPLAVLPLLLAAQDALLGVVPFGGLGWGSLAGPQVHTLAARLVVPALGGAGLVLLLGLVNAGWGALLLDAMGAWRARRLSRRLALGSLAWAALSVACLWPAPRPAIHPRAPGVTSLLVPGDLDLETLKAQRDTAEPIRYYLERTLKVLHARSPAERAAAPLPFLVIWPESAAPGTVEHGKALVELSVVGKLLGADLLLGSNRIEGGREYNALYLVNGGPFDFWHYEKRKLVPFGEYVPRGFAWLFPRKLTAGDADYAAGEAPPVLDWRGEVLGTAICFESILPEHVRAAVQGGASLLVAVANDAWLTPGARRQHLRLTALRGLEAGRDVLLVANRGWSGLLRDGKPLVLADWMGPPRLVRAEFRHAQTLYVRWGLLPLAGLGLVLLGLAAWRSRRA